MFFGFGVKMVDKSLCSKIRRGYNTHMYLLGNELISLLRVVYCCNYDKAGQHGKAPGIVCPGDEARVRQSAKPGNAICRLKKPINIS